jgi:hypothetical protein
MEHELEHAGRDVGEAFADSVETPESEEEKALLAQDSQ